MTWREKLEMMTPVVLMLLTVVMLVVITFDKWAIPCPPPERMIVCPYERELAYQRCIGEQIFYRNLTILYTAAVAALIVFYVRGCTKEKHSCGGEHGGG